MGDPHVSTMRRRLRWLWQRFTRGWDDRDIWSLDYTAAKWIAPRLKLLRSQELGHPCDMTQEEWNAALNKMIKAFEWYGSEERWEWPVEPAYCREGLELFAKHYGALWT